MSLFPPDDPLSLMLRVRKLEAENADLRERLTKAAAEIERLKFTLVGPMPGPTRAKGE